MFFLVRSIDFDTFYFLYVFILIITSYCLFLAIFKLRYLSACVSYLLMANFLLIWSIILFWNHSVPDQKTLSTCDDKMPCNNWLLCQKKITSSYLLLPHPMFINSSFTLKYQALGISHNP